MTRYTSKARAHPPFDPAREKPATECLRPACRRTGKLEHTGCCSKTCHTLCWVLPACLPLVERLLYQPEIKWRTARRIGLMAHRRACRWPHPADPP